MAGTIKGITIQIGADTTKLSTALNSANKAIKQTQKDLKSVEKALKLNPSNIALLKDKQALLNDQIAESKTKLDALKQAQKQLDSQNVDKNTKEYRELQTQIDLCEEELRQLEQEASNFGTVGAQAVAQFGEKLAAAGQKVSQFGQELTTKVTLPLVALGTVAANKFAEVDKTMQLTNATMGNTEAQAKLLNDAMKEAAANSTFGMNDAATAALNFARAGLKAEEAAAALAPAMNLAAGEGGNLDTVSAGLVATINGFGDSFDQTAHYADVFANACNNSALDIDSLSSSMSIAAPIFAAAGYSVNDASLYIGVMANAGIEASEAANALKTGMARLISPTEEAENWMNELGIAIVNADGSMKDAVQIQQELHDAFADLSESEQIAAASAIFGKNHMSKWLALINTAPSEVQELSDALTAEGTTASMADAMMSGFGGSLEKLKSSIDVAATSLGEALAPSILKCADAIQELVDKFNSLTDEQKETVAQIGIAVAALGPLLVVAGKLMTIVGGIMQLAPQLSSAIETITLALGGAEGGAAGLGSALAGLANPVGIVVAAILAALAATVTLWNTSEKFRQRLTDIWNEISGTFSETVADVKESLELLGIDFDTIVGALKGIWVGFCMALGPYIEAGVKLISAVLKGLMQLISGWAKIVSGIITGDWERAWDGVVTYVKGVLNIITAPFQAIIQGIRGWLDVIEEDFGITLSDIKNTVSRVWQFIVTVVKAYMEGMKALTENILTSIKNFFTNRLEDIKNVVTTVLTFIVNYWRAQLTAVQTVVSTVLTFIQNLWNTVLTAIQTAVSTALMLIVQYWTTQLDNIQNKVSTVLTFIQTIFNTGLNAVKNTVNTLLTGIKNTFTSTFESIKKYMTGVVDWLKKIFDFEWKLPEIELPHFKIEGKFDLKEGKVPKLSVEWYDKGGIFDRPSIIGVGEKRPEFVGALDDLRQIVREESGAGASAELLGQMVGLLSQLVDQGVKPITVNQTINAKETSYSEQQKAAAYEFKQIARALS